MIPRTKYLDFLIRSKDKQLIKVVSGVRRCGKSTLFEIYQNTLINNGINKNQIISINFEDLQFNHLRDYMNLYSFVMNKIQPDQMNYVFLDEIQHIPEFERVVDSLFIQKNIDIYITGSNAYFMSGELATLLSGRYIELKMLPLSFKEYCEGVDNQKSISEKYSNYLVNSSFPFTINIANDRKLILDYLEGIFNTVILKDVVAKNRIADVTMLEDVIKFSFHNIGNLSSTTKIANTMSSDGRKIDPKTVEKYIKALTESMIIYKAKRYNIKGKQHLKTLEKYYVVDIGLRYMLLGTTYTDVGHILENVVYLELLRRGYDVYVGQYGNLEVDFVAMNDQGLQYFQVTATIRDANTMTRELQPLLKINDHFPKYLLTLDEDPESNYQGIRILNALEFFLN
jgi:predicted AAA+ superfamily ATPase